MRPTGMLDLKSCQQAAMSRGTGQLASQSLNWAWTLVTSRFERASCVAEGLLASSS